MLEVIKLIMLDYYTIFASGQINTIPLDITGNTNKVLDLCKKAETLGYKFVAFPELCLCGYNCGDLAATSELTDACENAVLFLKDNLPLGVTAAVGCVLQASDNLSYDCYVLVKKDAILGVRTLRSFNNSKDSRIRAFSVSQDSVTIFIGDDLFETSGVFDIEGNIFDIEGVKTGIYFNDDDTASVLGAEVVIVPTAKRYELYAESERERELLEISKRLNCTVFTSNLMGCESGADIFDGRFYICQKGELIARSELLPYHRQYLYTKECGIVPEISEYDTNVRAVGLGLFDWMIKTWSHGFALSMSGGADSGLCAACVCYSQLAALEDLGYEEYASLMTKIGFNVPKIKGSSERFIKEKMMPQVLTTVYQGSEVSGSVTRTAAYKVAHNIGATHYEWSIADLVKGYTALINATTPDNPLSWDKDDLTLQNIQARVRAPGIWMIANRYNKLLITTSNASEGTVGYCTMDGDTAGGIAPVGGISKSRILKILDHIAKFGLAIDEKTHLEIDDMSYIASQAPTAELKPGQTDERDLMPYVVLDRIHYLHQIEMLKPEDIVEVLVPEFPSFEKKDLHGFVVKYFTRLARNQWKRERCATILHIEKADLNAKSGFLFPLLNDGYKSLLKNML